MEINNNFIEIIEEHSLDQVVQEPTRQSNILDIVLTTIPSLVKSVIVEPGMSDHDLVVTDLNIQIKAKKVFPRKVLLYQKGDMDSLKAKLNENFPNFNVNSANNTIEECWSDFKNILNNAIEAHIPTKT